MNNNSLDRKKFFELMRFEDILFIMIVCLEWSPSRCGSSMKKKPILCGIECTRCPFSVFVLDTSRVIKMTQLDRKPFDFHGLFRDCTFQGANPTATYTPLSTARNPDVGFNLVESVLDSPRYCATRLKTELTYARNQGFSYNSLHPSNKYILLRRRRDLKSILTIYAMSCV